MAPVRELEGATLHEFNAGEAYSSKRMRLEVTTMGTLITTIVRKSLGTDAASNRSVTYQRRPSVEPFWFSFPDSVGLDFTKCTKGPHGACVRAVRRTSLVWPPFTECHTPPFPGGCQQRGDPCRGRVHAAAHVRRPQEGVRLIRIWICVLLALGVWFLCLCSACGWADAGLRAVFGVWLG